VLHEENKPGRDSDDQTQRRECGAAVSSAKPPGGLRIALDYILELF